MKGTEIARLTREQLSELTGYRADTVSSIKRDGEGWRVTVELVELKRIPDSGDLLATYEVNLDETGDVMAYARTRRYLRSELVS
jgi:Gas vesicle synthesis protein GvpO